MEWARPGVQERPRARKRFGQHYLTNPGVRDRIIAAASLTHDDLVVEVGPGPGFLTRALLEHAGRVVAVEVDRDLAARLHAEVGEDPRLCLLTGDILKTPIPAILAAGGAQSPPCPRYKVVANLPYYITAPILRWFLTAGCKPVRMVVMVQLEVARSITAAPGDLGILGVAVQYYGRPSLVAQVSPGSFSPTPSVRSAVLAIDVYATPAATGATEDTFFRTVRAGFCAPRKQLHNALAQGLGLPAAQVDGLLGLAGVDPKRRAETLSLPEWGRLAAALATSAA